MTNLNPTPSRLHRAHLPLPLLLQMPPERLPIPPTPTPTPHPPPETDLPGDRPDEVNPEHPPEIIEPSLPGEHAPVRDPQPLSAAHARG